MKSFFIQKQLKNCNPTMTGWLRSAGAGIKLSMLLFFSFFLSSNLSAQTDGDPADWQALIANANYIKINSPRVDLLNSNLDEALGSGAKDVNDFPLWHWSYGANDKTDIHNATIVLLPGHVVRFAADRFAQNGDAEIGIWLLKGPLSTNADGTFTGQHTNGDVLITSKFTNGGGKATITVRTWQNGALSSADVPPSGDAEVNSTEKNVPAVFQDFQSKFGALNKYPQGAFFEGELDLDDIEGTDACFTRFLFETSQSQSNTEALGDFLLGNFNTKPNPPSVTPAEKCYDGTEACATASCGSNNGTLIFYDEATGGNVVASPCRTAIGTSTFYAACNADGCESDRVPVTVTINPIPTVNGLVSQGENDNSVDDGITKNSDDNYTMRISKTLIASLTASAASGTAPYTYTWEELDADAFTSLTPLTGTSTGNATFAIAAPPAANLRDAYRFRVTVVDSKGCTSYDELVINIDASAPVCVINGADPVCAGSQNNIYTTNTPLNPDFTYTWSISSTNGSTLDGGSPQAGQISQVSVDAGATAGSYTITLSIISGTGVVAVNSPCTKTVQVILVAPTSSKTDVVCNGESNGTMTAVGAGGTAPYSYTISPAGNPPNTTGASSGIFTGLAAGTYTITATDANGCAGTTSKTIGQPDALTCSLTTPTTLTCGSSGTVSGTISGGTAAYTCSAAFNAAGVTGGWSVTNCVVTGTGISVSYTSGLAATSAELTVNITDAHGCTSTCSVTVQCTGGQACSPGFWRNQTQYWDGIGNDVAVNNMPGSLTDPVTPGGTFVGSTNFWAYFDIPVNKCGLSENANLTMAQAMVNNNISNVACKSLVFHGIANLLSASLLPNTYPFPAGSGGNFSGLYTMIRNALMDCDCGSLSATLGAISALHTGTYCQDAANALNSFVSRETSKAVDDGGINVSTYPNPYNNVVNFKFASPTSGKAVLEVYDILGRKLAILYKGNVNANVPVNVKYNVPTVNRVSLIYKLTVNDKSVRGNILPEK